MSVNTVDTLYAAFPMFIYLNPELGGYLLAPLLEYQDSISYTLEYAAKNIGASDIFTATFTLRLNLICACLKVLRIQMQQQTV